MGSSLCCFHTYIRLYIVTEMLFFKTMVLCSFILERRGSVGGASSLCENEDGGSVRGLRGARAAEETADLRDHAVQRARAAAQRQVVRLTAANGH